MIKLILLILIVVAIVFGVMKCTASDSLDSAPESVKQNHEAGDSIPASTDLFSITQSCDPAKKKDGYISSVTVKADIKGYDADYTYFDCSVVVTWTYTEISDTNPTGAQKTISQTIELGADGNGSCDETINLENCRGISNIEVSYEWSGTATKL